MYNHHLYFKDKISYMFYLHFSMFIHVYDTFDLIDIELNGGEWYELRNGRLVDGNYKTPLKNVVDSYTDKCDCPVSNKCKLTIAIRIYDN